MRQHLAEWLLIIVRNKIGKCEQVRWQRGQRGNHFIDRQQLVVCDVGRCASLDDDADECALRKMHSNDGPRPHVEPRRQPVIEQRMRSDGKCKTNDCHRSIQRRNNLPAMTLLPIAAP